MRVKLKFIIPAAALLLAVVVPIMLFHTDAKQHEREHFSYSAVLPDIASGFDAPADLIWTEDAGIDAGEPEEMPSYPMLDEGFVPGMLGDVYSGPHEIAEAGYIWCDAKGNGIGAYVNSSLGPRDGGVHRGEDLQPTTGWRSFGPNEVFAVCPFSGVVERAGYDASTYGMGYNVMVRISKHVTLTYMHLGYGSGKAVQYNSYTPASRLVANFPFQNVGYPDQWILETEWCKKTGSMHVGNPLRTVGPSSIRVSVGDRIRAGTVIGVPGDTGNSTGLHAHIMLQYDGGYYARISDVLAGKSLADVNWYYFYGTRMYSGTAYELGLDIDDLLSIS